MCEIEIYFPVNLITIILKSKHPIKIGTSIIYLLLYKRGLSSVSGLLKFRRKHSELSGYLVIYLSKS
jgi:hypothetical protein